MNFWRNAKRGYLNAVSLVNVCWKFLFSGEWHSSVGNAVLGVALAAVLVPVTPFVYVCIAPFVAFLEGTKEEDGAWL